mgnify:CR=1 FL=1
MRKFTLVEITKTDTPALTSIINYWKDYDTNSVLLAYGELKRRSYSFNEQLSKRINDFSKSKNDLDIDILLSSALKNIGYVSYSECYEKEIASRKKIELDQSEKIEIGHSQMNNNVNNHNNSPAKTALYILGGLLLIPGLFQFYSAWQLSSIDNPFINLIGKNLINQKVGFGSLLTIGGGVLILFGRFISTDNNRES